LSYFKSGKKNNWTAIVLCLFAGTTFWFFNALNKTYTTNIKYPISVDFDTEVYQEIKPLPETLHINLTGAGWDLLRKSLGVKVAPLVIHLEKPDEIKKIVGSTLPALITDQLNDVQLNYVLTDTLFVNVDKRVSKRFYLHVDSLTLFLEKNFALVTPVTLSQDSVTLTGPESLLLSLGDTITISIDEKEIDDRYSEEVPILIPQQEIITRDPPTVTVTFNVAEYLPEEQRVPLSIENIPDKVLATLMDSTVIIKYKKPENIENVIPADSFRVVMDFKTLNRVDTSLYPVLIRYPENLLEIQLDTSRVKIILHE